MNLQKVQELWDNITKAYEDGEESAEAAWKIFIEYSKEHPEERDEFFRLRDEEEQRVKNANKLWQKNQRVHMEGDIIITDPCYVVKDELWHKFIDVYWKDASKAIGWLGFRGGIIADTLYGDWSCGTYQVKDIKETIDAIEHNTQPDGVKNIGSFCADAGLVCVFYLDDCLKHNEKEVKELLEKDWCATVIKDFCGDVYLWDHTYEGEYNGKTYVDTDRCVIGEGNINFIGLQTGI